MTFAENPHPLDGVFERLNRAERNIRDLDDRLREFGHQNPQGFMTQFDPGSRAFSHNATSVKNPGYWVPVRVGEILFLLRSCLDHLIAQWLIPRTSAADLDRVLEVSYFPIYIDGDWNSFDWNKIPGATPELKAAISALQPCNRVDGLPRVDHPLAVLASMHNTDKHRLLLVTVVKAHVTTRLGPDFRGVVSDLSGEYIPGSSNVVGYVDAPIVTGQLADGGEMDVQFESSAEIAFKHVETRQGEPVIATLDDLSHFVRKVITDFGIKFFP